MKLLLIIFARGCTGLYNSILSTNSIGNLRARGEEISIEKVRF